MLCLTMLMASGCERADGSSTAPGSYTVRETGIAMRTGGPSCMAHPGTDSCTEVLLSLRPGQRLYPVCQRRGQLVGRNTWWLFASGPRGRRGWVSGWYIDHPTNRLPGVDDCTTASFTPPRFGN